MLVINILLLIAAFASAIVAFGGETWVKGDKPLLRRITARGWISILAALIALALGAGKEFLTRSQEHTKEIEDQRREAQHKKESDSQDVRLRDLQGKASHDEEQLSEANKALDHAKGELSKANDALRRNERVVSGIADLDRQIHWQISLANQSLGKSREALRKIENLQADIRNVALLEFLSRNQSELSVEAVLGIHPIRFSATTPLPKTVVDLVFPAWREDGVQDPEKLVIGFQLRSHTGKLIGSLWGFRHDPYEIKTIGAAAPDESSSYSGTITPMYGSATVKVGSGGSVSLIASYRFPTSQIPGKYLSDLSRGTKIFTAVQVVRDNLEEAEKQRLIEFWSHLFMERGAIRIPLMDLDNVFMEYELRRGAPTFAFDGLLSTVEVSYFIDSLPSFHVSNL